MISVLALSETEFDDVLRINAESQPGVAALVERELVRLCAISGSHLAAVDGEGDLVGYLLAFARHDAYDGEEFLELGRVIPGPFLYIDQIAIAARNRRTGVGRTLYDALIHAATRQGINTLCCEVNLVPPNPESMAFHEQLGFDRKGIVRVSDGRTVALLTRSVSA